MKLEDAEKTSSHYINNKEFLQALIEYKKCCGDASAADESRPQIPTDARPDFLARFRAGRQKDDCRQQLQRHRLGSPVSLRLRQQRERCAQEGV